MQPVHSHSLSACQLISPVFVDYNDCAYGCLWQWINQQSLLSMQQKRSLAQLSKAQQQAVHIGQIQDSQKICHCQENSIAMHCALQHVSQQKIQQLQQQVFDPKDLTRILEIL